MSTTAAAPGEWMTMAEMEAHYPKEWVLIVDPVHDERWEVLEGRVVFHSADRDEVDAMDAQLRPRSAAVYYLGPLLGDGIDGFCL